MRTLFSRARLPAIAAGALLGLAALPVAAHAADADKPYSNVNKKNDAGNNTGDKSVDKLNAEQLDQNQPHGSKSDGFDRSGQSNNTYKPKD
jgi:hypothetical protein